jgi:SAM-dependent methyltransferase
VSTLASLAPAGRALELGVGTGRLAIPLAAAGVEVWGVDNSPAMLEQLRGKPGAEGVHVVDGDFADVGTLVDGEFDLAFVAFNTLFELPSQDAQVRCVTGVAQRLRAGGLFVVEAFVPDVTQLEQSVTITELGDDFVRLAATRHDPPSQTTATQYMTVRPGAVELDSWTIRYATVPEIDLMARLAGLRLRDRWGGWREEPFTAASSTHVSVYVK